MNENKQLGLLPWSKPDYLNLDWSKPNAIPTPHTRVPVEEALRWEYMTYDNLRGIGFDQCFYGTPGTTQLYNVHYRFYSDRAYAMALRFGTIKWVERMVRDLGGEKWDSDIMRGYAYHVVAFRIGCRHPHLKDGWEKTHTRTRMCPDCGYLQRFDTSG